MNIFKSIGIITSTATNSIVKTCGIIDKSLDVVEDCVDMGKLTTSSMLDEMAEENRQSLAELKAKAK